MGEETQIKYKRKKKNLFVAKAMEANVWLLLQVKIETKARFLAMRPEWAAGDLADKKYFSSFFYYVLKKTLTEEGKRSKVVKRKDYVL